MSENPIGTSLVEGVDALGAMFFRFVLFGLTIIVGIPLWLGQKGCSYVQNASSSDRVWIVELNPNIIHDRLQVLRNDKDMTNYYDVFGSVSDAEEWLLKRGYRKRSLLTPTVAGRANYKTFPVKGRGRYISVIDIVANYGDGEYRHLIFYHDDKEAWDTFGFSEWRHDRTDIPFKMPWICYE